MKIAAHDLPALLGETLDEVATLLERAGVSYMLIGGLAVGIHVSARATKDIDFSVMADEPTSKALVGSMEAAGFTARVQGPLGAGAIVRFSRTGADGLARWVDVLFAGTPFEERALQRASRLTALGRELPVVSVEDLLVFKLIAGRPQDVADAVRVIVEHGGELDRSYLTSAIAEWDLADEFTRIEGLARAGSAQNG